MNAKKILFLTGDFAEDYEAIDVEELSARLRGRRVAISQIRIGATNRKGVWLHDLQEPDEDVDA